MNFYIDDSGTRNPDRNRGREPQHGYDWFGLGGVLIRQEDEGAFRAEHSKLFQKWNIQEPLHSSEIRSKSKNFKWLGELSPERYAEFMDDLTKLVIDAPVIGMACVIDRPGYNHRYREKYGRQRWSLCKTAFAVAVERAAKYAKSEGYRLRILLERCDKKTDKWSRAYYEELQIAGMPFSPTTSGRYAPLNPEGFSETLYEFRTKAKSSPVMQLADLYLWPMCIGGYHAENVAYQALVTEGKLIDSKLRDEEMPYRGIKYSCWDLVQRPQNS